MKKVSIMFIDTDDNYLMALEKKFSEEIGGYLNISIITDMSYFGEYFMTPRDIDILVINERLYNVELKKHNIGQIYILTETPINNDEDKLYNLIYKYTSVSDIFVQVAQNEKLKECMKMLAGDDKGVITVCSPSGGSGKTTLAIASALSLARLGKRVLYVSRDYLQSFGYYFGTTEEISNDTKNKMKDGVNISQELLSTCIRNNIIDYIMPFSEGLDGIDNAVFQNIINGIKDMNIYDYIVIDTDKVDCEGLKTSIEHSDRVVVVTTQEEIASTKLKKFATQIKDVDKSKMIYICNKYKEDRKNELLNNINLFYVKEYVYYDETFVDSKVSDMLKHTEITKLANLFL